MESGDASLTSSTPTARCRDPRRLVIRDVLLDRFRYRFDEEPESEDDSDSTREECKKNRGEERFPLHFPSCSLPRETDGILPYNPIFEI